MKRIICIVLALLLCAPLLAACSNQTKLDIVVDGKCSILYDATQITDEQAQDFAARIEKSLGAEPELISTDSFLGKITVKPNTIVLGNVDLEICRTATEGLRNKDYVVGVYGDIYLIAGTAASATVSAMNYFRKELLPDEDEGVNKLTVSSKNNYRYDGNYAINNMSIGGVPLRKCEIVIPQESTVSEHRMAVQLRELLLAKTGYNLPIVAANEVSATGQIRIGSSICSRVDIGTAHSYDMRVSGSVLEIAAESLYGYEEARTAFQDQVLGGKKETYPLDDTFLFSGNGATRATARLENDAEVRLFFNNIWGGTDGDEKQRIGQLVELFLEYSPDVLGLQECSSAMYEAGIYKLLDAGYAEVQTGSVSPRTPLFYRTDTVEVLKSGHLKLNTLDFSDTQYVYLLPAGVSSADMAQLMSDDKKGPDDDSSKGLTWAIFRIKATGHVFFAGSTHLWWQGRHDMDDAARIIQMEVMKAFAVKTAAAFMEQKGLQGELPIYIGGDYNSRTSRKSYASMSSNTAFDNINSFVGEADRLKKSTMHNYPTFNDELKIWEIGGSPRGNYDSALDHIFAYRKAEGTYEVVRIEMLEEDYAFLSSDHSPIFADLNFTATAPTLGAVQ